MVSAGTAYKLPSASTARRTRGATSRKAHVVLVAGSNIAECAPITTRLHLAVPRPRRQADRRRPADDADHAQRRPLPAGAAGHRPRAVPRRCCTSSCATAWDHEFIDAHTTGFEAVAASVQRVGPASRGARSPASRREAIEQAARWIGEARARDGAPRARHRAPAKGVENVPRLINLCSPPATSAATARAAR